ncbi:hypothetical protein ACIPV2_08655 [Microbacterium sp. NPDC089987]|uniref:hypothetical protein n=1 Tax=Microbacterium sp. NPDC089987 TaxID=3364202 RepID=UPI0037F289BD
MNDVLIWLGHYWWLAFPLMGVAGGIGKSWERASKRRHERRLETLRLKGEIKAAQLAARGGTPPPQTRKQVRETAAEERASTVQLLERLFAEHDEITARWLEYELDVAKLIAFPAMSDGRQPLTAAFLRAKKIADTLRPASADAKLSEAEIAEYVDAVGDYAVAFDIAERDARRLRDANFSEVERKRLDRARHLLTVALDDAATQAERNLAYKRVREELDGLILLSDEAVEVLEQKVAGQIGWAQASASPVGTPAPAAAATPPPVPEAEQPAEPEPAAAPEPERMPLRREEPRA